MVQGETPNDVEVCTWVRSPQPRDHRRLLIRDGRPEAVFAPVALDERMVRTILTGNDPHPRTGGDLKGGSLASRLPKVSAASLGLAA